MVDGSCGSLTTGNRRGCDCDLSLDFIESWEDFLFIEREFREKRLVVVVAGFIIVVWRISPFGSAKGLVE